MSRELGLLHAVTDWCYGDIEYLLDFCKTHGVDLEIIAEHLESYDSRLNINDWIYEALYEAAKSWVEELKGYYEDSKLYEYLETLEENQFHIQLNYMCSCYDNNFLSNYVGSEDYEGALNYLREEKLI